MWRGVSDVRVAQPAPFFDPKLPDRAQMRDVPPDALRRVFRKRGFRLREAVADDGTRFVYGDRNKYSKLATLFTHLGLILFLAWLSGLTIAVVRRARTFRSGTTPVS